MKRFFVILRAISEQSSPLHAYMIPATYDNMVQHLDAHDLPGLCQPSGCLYVVIRWLEVSGGMVTDEDYRYTFVSFVTSARVPNRLPRLGGGVCVLGTESRAPARAFADQL